eukprot:Gb_21968 [translate_table: standard]
MDSNIPDWDTYRNLEEEGQKIKGKLTGPEFQDQESFYRKIDDRGCVNLGELLEVIACVDLKGSFAVSLGNQILIQERFHSQAREIKVSSGIPKQCQVGLILQNVEILNERGNINAAINDKESFIIRIKGPDGWSRELHQVPIPVYHTGCNGNKDINCRFTGFTIPGRVLRVVGEENSPVINVGPANIKVELISIDSGLATTVHISFGGILVEHNQVTISQPFQATGFTVGGRFVNTKGIGVEGVKILVDGRKRATIDLQGYYKLDQVTSTHYTIKAENYHFKFSSLENLMVLPNTASTPEIKVMHYGICGFIELETANYGGNWQAAVVGIVFSQALVDIHGSAICKEACSSLVSISFASVDVKALKGIRSLNLSNKSNDFVFEKVFSGAYHLEIKHGPPSDMPNWDDDWGWEQKIINVDVGITDHTGITFVEKDDLIFIPRDLRNGGAKSSFKKVLFYPRGKHVVVKRDGCQAAIPPFMGIHSRISSPCTCWTKCCALMEALCMMILLTPMRLPSGIQSTSSRRKLVLGFRKLSNFASTEAGQPSATGNGIFSNENFNSGSLVEAIDSSFYKQGVVTSIEDNFLTYSFTLNALRSKHLEEGE